MMSNGGDAPAQLKSNQSIETGRVNSKRVASFPAPTYQLASENRQSKGKSDAIVNSKKNNTGLPDNLKSGVESLSGYSLDDVKVHYNSDKPAQLKAHAFAQGTDIHLGSGQEKHLPHEAWHVIQQKQGRVQPTKQMKSDSAQVNVNDDTGLEKEADMIGAKELQRSFSAPTFQLDKIGTG